LSIALGAAFGCGGGADQAQQASATANTGLPTGDTGAGNAPALLVPMSMVIPKKAPPPPQMTAPAIPQAPAGGTMPGAPTGAAPMIPGMAPAMTPGTGAAGAAAPITPPAAMMPAAAPAAPGSAAGAATSGVPEAELSMLRDICVAEINMYRATVTTTMLKPLTRATAEQEECSEKGAKMDGDSMAAHGAARAGVCRSVGLGAENTCPGWPVGGDSRFGGSATIADALKGCLKAMWEEGDPPMGRDACIKDSAGCFQEHGHYLNMSDPNNGTVACSFYKMMDGKSYWMNQDFTSSFSGGRGRM
jgi:hypothetical protein